MKVARSRNVIIIQLLNSFLLLIISNKDICMSTCKDRNGDNWELYKDVAEKWRWRRTASNGRIVGASTEGYVNKSDCISNAQRNGCNCTL